VHSAFKWNVIDGARQKGQLLLKWPELRSASGKPLLMVPQDLPEVEP